MSRRISDAVADRHIRQAEAEGKRPVVVGSFGANDAALAMPRRPTGTAAQKAEAVRIEAEENEGGAYEIAWIVKLLHGCRQIRRDDPPCRDRRHKADVLAAAEMLDMLQVREAAGKRQAALPGQAVKVAPKRKTGPRRFEQ